MTAASTATPAANSPGLITSPTLTFVFPFLMQFKNGGTREMDFAVDGLYDAKGRHPQYTLGDRAATRYVGLDYNGTVKLHPWDEPLTMRGHIVVPCDLSDFGSRVRTWAEVTKDRAKKAERQEWVDKHLKDPKGRAKPPGKPAALDFLRRRSREWPPEMRWLRVRHLVPLVLANPAPSHVEIRIDLHVAGSASWAVLDPIRGFGHDEVYYSWDVRYSVDPRTSSGSMLRVKSWKRHDTGGLVTGSWLGGNVRVHKPGTSHPTLGALRYGEALRLPTQASGEKEEEALFVPTDHVPLYVVELELMERRVGPVAPGGKRKTQEEIDKNEDNALSPADPMSQLSEEDKKWLLRNEISPAVDPKDVESDLGAIVNRFDTSEAEELEIATECQRLHGIATKLAQVQSMMRSMNAEVLPLIGHLRAMVAFSSIIKDKVTCSIEYLKFHVELVDRVAHNVAALGGQGWAGKANPSLVNLEKLLASDLRQGLEDPRFNWKLLDFFRQTGVRGWPERGVKLLNLVELVFAHALAVGADSSQAPEVLRAVSSVVEGGDTSLTFVQGFVNYGEVLQQVPNLIGNNPGPPSLAEALFKLWTVHKATKFDFALAAHSMSIDAGLKTLSPLFRGLSYFRTNRFELDGRGISVGEAIVDALRKPTAHEKRVKVLEIVEKHVAGNPRPVSGLLASLQIWSVIEQWEKKKADIMTLARYKEYTSGEVWRATLSVAAYGNETVAAASMGAQLAVEVVESTRLLQSWGRLQAVNAVARNAVMKIGGPISYVSSAVSVLTGTTNVYDGIVESDSQKVTTGAMTITSGLALFGSLCLATKNPMAAAGLMVFATLVGVAVPFVRGADPPVKECLSDLFQNLRGFKVRLSRFDTSVSYRRYPQDLPKVVVSTVAWDDISTEFKGDTKATNPLVAIVEDVRALEVKMGAIVRKDWPELPEADRATREIREALRASPFKRLSEYADRVYVLTPTPPLPIGYSYAKG